MLQTQQPPRPPGLQPAHERSVRGGPSALSNGVAVLLLIGLATYGLARFEREPARADHLQARMSNSTPLAAPFNRPIDLDSTCDGRSMCSQMTSCTEAKAFLRSCPGVQQLDRDGNGIPCEKSWCNSPLAN